MPRNPGHAFNPKAKTTFQAIPVDTLELHGAAVSLGTRASARFAWQE